jgi:outer membrane protein assembly complex protein YaeT
LLIEPLSHQHSSWGALAPLRRILLTTLAALALAAKLSAPGFAWSAPPRQSVPAQEPSTPPPAPPAFQQESMAAYQGAKVEAIEFPNAFEGNDARRMRAHVVQAVGQSLDRDQIRQSIQALYATGRFVDIRVEAERTADGGVRLEFVTTPNYFVGEVEVGGNPDRPSVSQVINASKLELGEPFTQDKLDRAVKNVKQLLEENGYYRASLNEKEVKHIETQQIGILFTIAAGPQAHVGQLSVTGSANYTAEQVEEIAHLHPGDALSTQRISNALDHLRLKYQKRNRWLAQVRITERVYRPAANAVDFTFDIDPGPTVDIIIEGFHISRGVLKRNVPVYEENALDDDLLNEGRRNLTNYLQTRGYFDAKVTVKKTAAPSGKELRVIYDIDAGPRHKLVKAELTGNRYFDTRRLQALMQVQPAGKVLSHGRYDPGLLNDDARTIEDLYRANGFEQVKTTTKVVDDYGGKDNQLAVSLHIDEGVQTLVGALHIVGNESKMDEPFPVVNLAPNEPFSESLVADDRDIILNHYFNHGFPDASFEASAKPIAGQPDRMDVTYTIKEGERVSVDRVLVSGLNFTRPPIVQREIQMQPGDALSQIDMLDTQKRLYDLGIFGQVDTAVQNPDGDEHEKNVLVQVQEAKRYTFNYGFGFEFQTGQPAGNTNEPQGGLGVSPRVSFGVTRLNFLGRDQTLTFNAHVGRLQQRALASYEAPRWLNNPKWKFTATALYDDTVDVTTFTSERLEGWVQAEQTISKSSTIDYRFNYRRVQATDLPENLSLVPLLSQPVRVGGPDVIYIRDRRDNALESTKGTYNTVDAQFAASYFGSQRNFSSILVQNATYHAFGKNRVQNKKFVFARSLRVGVETPFGNTVLLPPGQCPTSGSPQCIPLPELFLSGGGNSHRGFGLNQAGPRDPVFGFPVGGGALFLNNLEMRFPAAMLPLVQDKLSFALFHDAGNVFTTGRNMLDNLLRWKQKDPQLCLQQSTATQCNYSYISHAIGVGVRYKTPIGPVRFDFGYNLNPPAFPSHVQNPDGSAGAFTPEHATHFNVFFSVGQTF